MKDLISILLILLIAAKVINFSSIGILDILVIALIIMYAIICFITRKKV